MAVKNKQFIGAFYCITAAAVWGMSFVCQSIGRGVGTFTFNTLRMMLGALVLLPVIALRNKKGLSSSTGGKKLVWFGGGLSGIAMFFGNNLQQEAFCYIEDVGKVGFITALYILLVPIFNFLIFKKKSHINVWFGVLIGTVGLYFLCSGDNGFRLEKGDILTIICAFTFAAQILIVDKFSDGTDPVEFSAIQFFVCSVLSGICMLIFEEPTLALVMQKQNLYTILYAGIMSCGVAFTFQTFGQKYTEPAVASLLLCLESAFSVFFGWLVLHQMMGRRSLVGCAIMLLAVVLTQVQLPVKVRKTEAEKC